MTGDESSGRATGGVRRLGPVVAKLLRPGETDPAHWAYWRREALAYTSGLLPAGPTLRAPRLVGVEEAPERVVIYLEDVAGGPPVPPERAAYELGAWHRSWLGGVPGVRQAPWLAGSQLRQRVAAKGRLSFAGLPLPAALLSRLAGAWDARQELLPALAALPQVLCHGDFHTGNLFMCGPTVVAVDWGSIGRGPVGGDLAYLALGDGRSPVDGLLAPYLKGLGTHARPARLGYCATAGLTGVSRTHWMLRRDPAAPVADYARWSVDRVDEAVSALS